MKVGDLVRLSMRKTRKGRSYEDMIGLEGPNKKVLSKRVIRMMRAAGMPRPRPEEINDVLAAAAFTYINQEFVDDEDH